MNLPLKLSACLCAAVLTSLAATAQGQIITTGLRLQLDATAITGVDDGEAFANWFDISGNDNNFQQVDPESRPIYFTNGINGLAAVEFGGGLATPQTKVMNLLSGGSGLNITGDELTIFMVVQFYSPTGEQALFGSYGGAGTGYSIYKQTSANGFVFYAGDNLVAGSFDVDDPTIVTAVKSSTALTLLQDGGEEGTIGSTNPITSSSNTVTLGWSAYNSAPLRGYIGEVLVYDRTLDSGELAQVTNYLDDKWINPVPEPSVTMLASLGGIAAFLFKRSRRK